MTADLTTAELADIFKALADPNRLRLLGLLAEQPLSVEQLAEIVGLRPSTVSHHLARLAEAGLVSARSESYYNIYSPEQAVLQRLAPYLLGGEALPSMAAELDAGAYDRMVVKNYSLPGGKLKSIPAQRKKLEAVLRRMALDFEPGLRYSERQVNDILRQYHEDTATLRRELVGYHLLVRQGGEYWRPEPLIETEERQHMDTIDKTQINEEPLLFFRALANMERLKVAGALALGMTTADEIAAAVHLPSGMVMRHLALLRSAGLTKAEGSRWTIDQESLEASARRVLSQPRSSPEDFEGEAYDRKVLSDYTNKDGRLKSLPTQEKKLQAVLRYVVRVFEAGKQYPEKEVNQLLSRYYDDTASLRRYLVDFKFMQRDKGLYWLAQ